MLRRLGHAAVLVIVGSGFSWTGMRLPSRKVKQERIALHLDQPTRTYSPGEDVSLRVSVTNRGDQALLICRILGAPGQLCFWALQARDGSGKLLRSITGVGDSVPVPPTSFADTLISNWIALPPGCGYSTALDVHDVLGANPSPGLYQIRVALSSDGPGAQGDGLRRSHPEQGPLPLPIGLKTNRSHCIWSLASDLQLARPRPFGRLMYDPRFENFTERRRPWIPKVICKQGLRALKGKLV